MECSEVARECEGRRRGRAKSNLGGRHGDCDAHEVVEVVAIRVGDERVAAGAEENVERA